MHPPNRSKHRSKQPSSSPSPQPVPHWVITIGVIVASTLVGAVISELRQPPQTASAPPSVSTKITPSSPSVSTPPKPSISSTKPEPQSLWPLQPNALQSNTVEAPPVLKLQTFERLVRAVDPQGVLVLDARQGQPETLLEITVSHFWYEQPHPVRLQMARNLWRVWSTTASIANPDQARIRLVDPEGYTVGGSGFLGSLIYVNRD